MKAIGLHDLIAVFPHYEQEMKDLVNGYPCGCSLCVWNAMKRRHPELNDGLLPKRFKDRAWG